MSIGFVAYFISFMLEGQSVFMTEWYQYDSCALTIKNGNHLTASKCDSLQDKEHKNESCSHNDCSAVARQAAMQPFLGKGLFLPVVSSAPDSWGHSSRLKCHLVLLFANCQYVLRHTGLLRVDMELQVEVHTYPY